jgi:hypothetical protein
MDESCLRAAKASGSEWKIRMTQANLRVASAQQQDVSWNITPEYSVRYST